MVEHFFLGGQILLLLFCTKKNKKQKTAILLFSCFIWYFSRLFFVFVSFFWCFFFFFLARTGGGGVLRMWFFYYDKSLFVSLNIYGPPYYHMIVHACLCMRCARLAWDCGIIIYLDHHASRTWKRTTHRDNTYRLLQRRYHCYYNIPIPYSHCFM